MAAEEPGSQVDVLLGQLVDELTRRNDERARLPKFMDVRELAESLKASERYVREHAPELGGFRLPSEGGQGDWRFDPAAVRRSLSSTSADPPKHPEPPRQTARKRQPKRGASGTQLLPIAGEDV